MTKTLVLALLLAMSSALAGCVVEPVHSDRQARSDYGSRDRDRDGVPNRYDRDRDGDGVSNRNDRAPDNPYRR